MTDDIEKRITEARENVPDYSENVELGRRIFDARTKRGWSQQQLADAVGATQSTIDRIEKGAGKGYSRYHQALLEELGIAWHTRAAHGVVRSGIRRFTYTVPTHKQLIIQEREGQMPVYASADKGNGIISITPEPIEWITRPYNVESIKSAYAVLVEDASMSPAYEPGDKIFMNPLLSQRRDTDSIFYSETGPHGLATVKRLLKWTESEWHVAQNNPQKNVSLERKAWPVCCRIVGKFAKP